MASKKLEPSDFVHLHNHTHYSLLDGLQKIPEMLDKVKMLGMSSAAITDHGTLSGAIEFYKGCIDRDLNPLIGMEAYVAARKHTDRDPQKDKARYHLILLAMNNKGYENLMRLSTIANLEGFYHKPRIDHKLLEEYNEGLIVLSGCMGGEVSEFLVQGQKDKALETAVWYKKIFGDRYYIELQDHGYNQPRQAALNEQLLEVADELGIKPVVTADAHYLNQEDEDAHEILLCVQTGSYLTDEKRMSLKDWHLYLSDPKDIIARWETVRPDVISNTSEIAARCKVSIELGKILIPKFETPKGEDEKSYLNRLVYQGLAWRYGAITREETNKLSAQDCKKVLSKEVLERMEYELGVINSMGFNGYFLIVWDFVVWGKDRGIVFGPGRGSAAGSIVAYALRVTELDPLKYDLLFERFLNPDRISMPDIDIDIMDTRRDEVIDYVADKYGKDRVANIVTFGTMAARNAVRDVARVLQVPYADADRLAKMIPPPIQGRHTPLEKTLLSDKDLKKENESNEQSSRVFAMATRLEGTIRSHGVHAAGVVIAPDELVKFAPLEMAQKGVVSTQYSMNPVEDLGLLKMDFLGLSNLTTIKNCLRIVKKVYGVDIDIDTIDLQDKDTFKLLQEGNTTGVFQLESSGMRQYLRKLKPTVFDDIVAMVALYRPGPMQWIDDYINRKQGRTEITYLDPAMEDALKSTYGIIVYQEQVMQISRELAGFTGGQSDTLRKGIGKKIPEVLAKLKTDFIEGSIKTSNIDRGVVEELWRNLEDFAAYCFNKSHAACYGLIAYQTAYLKAHYPDAFLAAVMTSDEGNTDRLAIEIAECNSSGIKVLPPDVNESFHEFAIIKDKSTIRFGMDAVKNVGHGAVAEIIRARKKGGQFKDITDFVKRVNYGNVNRKAWESLIKAGAFDKFGSRGTLLNSLDDILFVASKVQKEMESGQTDLFGSIESGSEAYDNQLNVQLTEAPDPPKKQLLTWERELLGLYLSDHPLGEYKQYLEEKTIPISSIEPINDEENVTVGGIVQEVRAITTKNGQQMAFVKIEDANSSIELVVFPNVMKDSADLWIVDNVLLVKGKVNAQDRNGTVTDDIKILVSSAKAITEASLSRFKPDSGATKPKLKKAVAAKSKSSRLYIRLESTDDSSKLAELKNILDKSKGEVEVVLVLGEEKSKQALRLPQQVSADDTLLAGLKKIVGEEAVKLN